MKFKKVKLSDLGEIVGGSTPSTKNIENYGGNISWITPKDLANYNKMYIKSGERNITEKGFKSCSAKMLPKNSILFTSRAPIGYIAIAEKELCTNQGFKSIIPNSNVDYLFLYYLLKYNKEYIANFGSGTTFKEVSGTVMKNIEVYIPENIEEQKKISNVLFSIDKRIELNNQINDNLQNYIFKLYENISASIDTEVELESIANISSGKRPKIKDDKLNIPIIGASGVMAFTDESNYKKDIIIIGRVGTLGIVQRYNYPIWASDNTITIDTEYRNYIENYLKTIDYSSLNRGSTQPLLTQSDIGKQKVRFDEIIIRNFEKEIHVFKDKIWNNIKENISLEKLGDALLPKLMNGEIDLDKIEI